MRKLIIGLIAVGFVASLFWGYALVMDANPIEVRNVTAPDNLDMPESGGATERVEDTDVRVAKEARYVVLDPDTKETSRVFGFEKLLNPGMDTSRREVEKPYLIFYDSDYQCRVDADMGMFQIETSGSDSTPKDARLSGNVKIHVMPKPGSKISETLVEMDDLVFSSERSEFATDHKVHITSEEGELKGTGLVVIFDSAKARIDYLRIRDLEEIRIQGATDSKSEAKPETQSETKIAKAKTDTASADLTPTQPSDVSSVPSKKIESTEVKLAPPVRYYQCLLEDNVIIKYGNEIIVTGSDQVNIQNISFDQSDGDDQGPEQAKDESKKVSKPSESSGQKVEIAEKPSESLEQKSEPAANIEPKPEIIVTCDGGILLKPMEDEDAGPTSASQSTLPPQMAPTPSKIAKITSSSQHTSTVEVINLVGQKDAVAKSGALEAADTTDKSVLEDASDSSDSPPTKFEARKIDYNLLTGSGLAHGPVRFTFYQDPDPNGTAPKSWIPVTVTADENAEFFADSSQTIEQVVFNGNVMTTRTSQTPDFEQLEKLHSEKLTIDLDEDQAGKTDLSHLRMTEGKVYVESQRVQEDRKLSDVKLYCSEISYDRVADVILAEGPGKIEMVNNEDSQTEDSDSENPMNRPAVAMVDNFTTIHWDMGKQSIIADGDQDAMKLAYYPILEGQIQKQIFVYSMQLELSYLPDTSEIKKVFTDKSIIYEEWNSDMTKRLHYIVGQTLDYDAVDGDGWMKISGTPAVPCNVDGARMSEVLVNPVTGEIDASISTTPGIMKTP
ncbi:MAG: hypothetical protein ACYTBY_00050 [Planctomycetota bacterium]|jgi:hypothetical protein